MTLGNMRALGIHSLIVSCGKCNYEWALLLDACDDTVNVSTFGPRIVCVQCGTVGAEARPNWREMRAPPTGSRDGK